MTSKIQTKTLAKLFVEQMGYDISKDGEVARWQPGLVLQAAMALVSTFHRRPLCKLMLIRRGYRQAA